MRYQLITGTQPQFEQTVEEALNDGWTVQGGTSGYQMNPSSPPVYVVGMIHLADDVQGTAPQGTL